MGKSGGKRAALSTVFPHGPQDTIHIPSEHAAYFG